MDTGKSLTLTGLRAGLACLPVLFPSVLPAKGRPCAEVIARAVSAPRSLASMQQELMTVGIVFETLSVGGSAEALKLLPEGLHEWNQTAYQLQRALGVELVYCPERLRKDNGRWRRAFYRESERRIYLADTFIFGVSKDYSFHHEVLHALLKRCRYLGRDSLFHGSFKSIDGKAPLGRGKTYRFYLSLEELATHALVLRLIARDFDGKPETRAFLRRRAKLLRKLASRTLRHSEAFLQGLDQGEVALEYKLESVRGRNGNEPDRWAGVADLTQGKTKMRLWLVRPEATALVERVSSPGGRRSLKRLVAERLHRLVDLAAELEQAAAAIVKALDGKESLSDEVLLALVLEPRRLSLEWMEVPPELWPRSGGRK